jgi:hypothetical protein
MNSAGFDKGEVLWIDPAVHSLPELPQGFGFRVQELIEWSDLGRAVWVRGLLIDGRGTQGRSLTLCVPTDQPRAVAATRVPPRTPPMQTRGVAAVEHGRHRAVDDPGLVGPPPGYERRAIR